MRVALERIDVGGATLDLPQGSDSEPSRVSLSSAKNVKGTLEQAPGRFVLSGVTAEELQLNAGGVRFGNVRLSETELFVQAMHCDLTREQDRTNLDAGAAVLRSKDAAVDVGTFHIEGELSAEHFELGLRGSEGWVEFGKIEVTGLHLRTGDVTVAADRAEAEKLRVAWGGSEGLELEFADLRVSGVAKIVTKSQEVVSNRLSVERATWRGKHLKIGSASLGQARLAARLSRENHANRGRSAGEGTHRAEGFLQVLDGLSGEIDVDVDVGVHVAVLGQRELTHELRVPIEDGAIDYRQFERNLSTVEDAFLDFSVREHGLILELGVPLLPTRGHGKKLMMWELDDADLALAEQDRVRLAVLPKGRSARSSASDDSATNEKAEGVMSLEHLAFRNIGTHLTLAYEPPHAVGAAKRVSFDELHVEGEVHYSPESDAQHGELFGGISSLDAQLEHLPLDGSELSVDAVRAEQVSDVYLGFQGLHVIDYRGSVHGLVVRQLDLARAA